MALPIKKIYIDSKHRNENSVSSAHFKYDLPESLLMPNNTGYYVCDVSIPHTWLTIEDGINNKLYFHISDQNDANINLNFIATIEAKNYTSGSALATEIQLQMLSELTGTAYANGLYVLYTTATQTFNISTTNTTLLFKILTKSDIANKLNGTWTTPAYDASKPHDINTDLLKQSFGYSLYNDDNSPFTTQYLNLQRIRNLYLHCTSLGTYSTISSSGSKSIVKKIQQRLIIIL